MSLERFRKVYSLLPESEKKLAIITIEDKAVTWEQAYAEIAKDTHLGQQIQEKLEKLNII